MALRARQAAEAAEETAEADARDVPLFADEPIDWTWLDAANVDVTIHIEQLPVEPFTLRRVRAGVVLHDASLALDPLEADLAEGRLDAHLNVRRQDDGGAMASGRIFARGLTPADLGIAEDQVRGGRTSMLIDLDTRGASPRELAVALAGELALEVRETVLENEMIELLGADVVAEAIRYLLPLDDREARTELRCAAAHVAAVDGVLFSNERIVLETANVTVRASLMVDLHDESLEMEFEPQPREETGTPCRAIFESQPADHDIDAVEEQMDWGGHPRRSVHAGVRWYDICPLLTHQNHTRSTGLGRRRRRE